MDVLDAVQCAPPETCSWIVQSQWPRRSRRGHDKKGVAKGFVAGMRGAEAEDKRLWQHGLRLPRLVHGLHITMDFASLRLSSLNSCLYCGFFREASETGSYAQRRLAGPP
jgi:hypothetical protein